MHSTGGSHYYEACGDSPAFTRPVFPSPAAAGWNSNGFGFYPELRTPRLPATHAKAGTALMDTGPGHVFNNGTSKQRDHSQRATSRRTPPFVVEPDQVQGGVAAGVQQRGDQPVPVSDATAVGAGHGYVRLDDPHG
jgi:hypothetical protein